MIDSKAQKGARPLEDESRKTPISPESALNLPGDQEGTQPSTSVFHDALRSTKTGFAATMSFLSTSQGKLIAVVVIALIGCFWALLRNVPSKWFDPDGYYTHGVLVPFLVGYILYERRALLKSIPIKGHWLGFVLLVPFLYVVYIASRTEMLGALTYMLILVLFATVLAIAGFKMTRAVAPAILYLIFALPFGAGFFDKYTNRFQIFSTDSAYEMLKAMNLAPYKLDSTQILVGNYNLYVAGACSGLKLTLSVTAFMFLFMTIGHLKWWANILLIAVILPLCIFINGIRIALIGVVGNQWGEAAGAQFHDWSGYFSILICFYILMKLTRALGWK